MLFVITLGFFNFFTHPKSQKYILWSHWCGAAWDISRIYYILEKYNNIVIPDTRFPNEIKMIRKLGGQVWAVKRGEDPDWLINLITKGEEPNDIHPSEWSWVTENVDHIIDNNNTIDDLKNKVSTLLNNIHT